MGLAYHPLKTSYPLPRVGNFQAPSGSYFSRGAGSSQDDGTEFLETSLLCPWVGYFSASLEDDVQWRLPMGR